MDITESEEPHFGVFMVFLFFCNLAYFAIIKQTSAAAETTA